MVLVVLAEELDLPVVAINPDDGSNIESMRSYGVEVVLVPDAGHFLMMEAPDRFNASLLEVLDGLSELYPPE